ncbi:MAG: hypothetical protein JO040_00235 [Gemmatimonadetes bacterium]|nr:hypothetical protein [Gemmatimonadota bacterium]
MKKLFLLLALIALGTTACSDYAAPPTAPASRPAMDDSPCPSGGYLGSDGKWVCY